MPTDTKKPTRRRAAPKRGVEAAQATVVPPPPLATRQDPGADPVEAANAAAAAVAPGLPEVPAGSSAIADVPVGTNLVGDVGGEPAEDDVRWLLQHLRGCPEYRGKSLQRVEVYEAPAPEKQGGGMVRVVRCQECGAHAREDELTQDY